MLFSSLSSLFPRLPTLHLFLFLLIGEPQNLLKLVFLAVVWPEINEHRAFGMKEGSPSRQDMPTSQKIETDGFGISAAWNS